jgi:chorismate mutase
VAVRGIRGAIDVARNEKKEILSKTGELLSAMVKANRVKADDVAAAIFSLTPDLNAEFPAIAARRMGWSDVPLMCACELDVPGAMKSVVRILLLVNTDHKSKGIKHQYLGKTKTLRPDLAAKKRSP